MNIERHISASELTARLIFLLLPTAWMVYLLLGNVSSYFGIIGDPTSGLLSFLPTINNISLLFTLVFAFGMGSSAIFYTFRFRFLVPFLGLALLCWLVYKSIDTLAVGEFDAFFLSVQFQSFSIIFLLGWLAGWGFLRLRYFSIFLAAAFLAAFIFLIAKSKVATVTQLLLLFSPTILYAIYIVFTAEQLYNLKENTRKYWWLLTRRLVLFTVFSLMVMGGILYLLRAEIKETVANYGGGGKQGQNSMLKKNKDGSFDLEQYTRLRGSLGRNNELLFAAHIDNYFPNTDIPNPLYLTAFHYTLFDTLTETFERDKQIPKNDLFEPKPNKIPLFFTQYDSSVIRNAMGDRLRKTVEVEVYSTALSPETYLAPSTGYFVQPIAIEKDFKDQFKSAFRAKSYVSELNSAYFIYNAKDPQIKAFQEQRFDVLRTVTDYEGVDKNFFHYYTQMPQDAKFRKITSLAQQITQHATTPVDKVVAIRDYFLSKDSDGNPLFSYTDNPGVPDIPSASKLMYFLFENRKGYCAYYAGATLFMLRALGIPSRITVGFLTVDRSDKNKGWYWYYADQAHAWVEVYFPGFGWLDFDTTVGNDDAQESPKPDGTPPMQPPKAWLAANGVVQEVDTLNKLLKLQVAKMVFHDKEYPLTTASAINLDMKIATIRLDSVAIPISSIQVGDSAMAVSYADVLKRIAPKLQEQGLAILNRLPQPTPIDEVYIKRKTIHQTLDKKKSETPEASLSTKQILITLSYIVGGLLLFWFLLPWLVLQYYILRHRLATSSQKPYWAYRAALYYLHQLEVHRHDVSPLQFAQQTVDVNYGTSFTAFMQLYLKQKYAQQPLSQEELLQLVPFLNEFLKTVRNRISLKKRFVAFINPMRMISFFVQPKNME